MFSRKEEPLEQQTQMLLLEKDETLINRIACKHKKTTLFTDGSRKIKGVNGVLNITTKRVAVSVDGVINDDAFAGYGIPLQNIRMVFPLKKDKVRVQYIGYNEKYKIPVRYQMIYELNNNESEIACAQITLAILKNTQNTCSENKRLFLFAGEKIVKQVSSTSRKSEGIFYVTNLGLYLEDDDNGLAFEMPYSMYHKSELRNNTIVIQYNEMHDDGSIHVHEFQVRPDKDSKMVFDIIKRQYSSSNANSEHDFESLKSMFDSLDGSELRQILYKKAENSIIPDPQTTWIGFSFSVTGSESYNLQKYIGYLADQKWGNTRPKVKWCYCSGWFGKYTIFGQGVNDLMTCHINGKNRKLILEDPEKFYTQKDFKEWHFNADFQFRQYEMILVKACLFADVPLDVLGDHSEEYDTMIEKFQKDFDTHREAEMNLAKCHFKLESFKESIKNAKTKEEYLKITKSSEYTECVADNKKYQKIRSEYTDKSLDDDTWDGKIEFSFNSYHWVETYRDIALKEFQTMLRKIYDSWKKEIPLQNFTDDADFSWLQYCLENVSYSTKDMAFFTGAKDRITSEIARSESVKKSLESFRVPDDIPKEDIFGTDCWYDKERKMYFSRCDSAEKASSVAIISRDDTARKFGFFAFGFDEKIVEMIHGIPAVSVPYDVFPNEKIPDEKRYVLLSYVKESQITPDMEKDRTRTVGYVENAPYTVTFNLMGVSWCKDEENKKIAISAYEKYARTGIDDQTTSYPPHHVYVKVLEYLTVEPREGLSNDGFNNIATPTELTLTEKRNTPTEYSFMGTDYPTGLLPLYERIRKHTFKILTGQHIATLKEDFEDVKKEYDSLFGTQQESQILPTVQV